MLITAETLRKRLYIRPNGKNVRWRPIEEDLRPSARKWNEQRADKPVKLYGSVINRSIKLQREYISLARVVYALHYGVLPDEAHFKDGDCKNLAPDNVLPHLEGRGPVEEADLFIQKSQSMRLVSRHEAVKIIVNLITEIKCLRAIGEQEGC